LFIRCPAPGRELDLGLKIDSEKCKFPGAHPGVASAAQSG
jgi:hypothetical protein